MPSKYPTPSADEFDPVDTVPDGLKWKPQPGYARRTDVTTLFSLGYAYKLIRDRTTGAVQYFKLRDTGPAKSPAETIDAEPTKQGQVRYRKGTMCWFVDTGPRWYLCKIVDRTPNRIVIESVNGQDADKQSPWPFGLLEFPTHANNPIFQRLRPLKARYQ